MKEIVTFFWERYHRAVQMDMANKLQGKPTYIWMEADEWITAYKNTLSKNKVSEFDKIWKQLESDLEDFRNGKKGSEALSLK